MRGAVDDAPPPLRVADLAAMILWLFLIRAFQKLSILLWAALMFMRLPSKAQQL